MSLAYVNGDLRDLMIGDVEVLRRIYVVFQDRNWTARPWVISNERIFAGKHSFEIAYDARGTFDAEPFHFSALLSGDDEGIISYEFKGSADAPFIRNRLGLCVLHPMSASGAACIVESVTGETVESSFPVAISPHQPFVDIRAITHEFAPGAWASTRLTGETYEMEDHRNWSDASFKTYCTPIGLPFPVEVLPGESLWQSLTVAVDIEDYEPRPAPERPRITAGRDAPTVPLPRIGLQLPADEPGWSDATADLLRDLGLDHLRVDVTADQPDSAARIREAARRASLIGARLVVALFVAGPADVGALAVAVADVDVDTWLVLDTDAKVSAPSLAAAGRAAFGVQARIGGGTNLYFTELNREPVVSMGLDVVAFSLNPQVHAADTITLVQNLAAQSVIASDATRLGGSATVHVGPVTLRPRFNPNATEPELDVSNTPLPANVDARQLSQLAANWTMGSVKYLAEPATIDAITYFETTGWRGVIERESGSAQPHDFPSVPGRAFPVYHALQLLTGFTGVRSCTSNLPQVVDAIHLVGSSGEGRLVVVSFSDHEVEVDLSNFDAQLSTVTLEPFGLASLDLRKAGS